MVRENIFNVSIEMEAMTIGLFLDLNHTIFLNDGKHI